MPIILLGIEVREITLKGLNTKHLFKIKALKNLEVFSGEQLNTGGSGTCTFLSFTKAVIYLLSTYHSLLLGTDRMEARIPTYPEYSWFLQSYAEHLQQTRNS